MPAEVLDRGTYSARVMPLTSDTLRIGEARRIALHAQGFNDPRPTGRVDRRHFRRVMGRLGLVQIDSVNVLTRSHELPVPRPPRPLRPRRAGRLAVGQRRGVRVLGPRGLPAAGRAPSAAAVADGRATTHWSGRGVVAMKTHPEPRRALLEAVRERGPVTLGRARATSATPSSGARPQPGNMWNWSAGQEGRSSGSSGGATCPRSATRRRSTASYVLPERVLPGDGPGAPTPTDDDAMKALLLRGGPQPRRRAPPSAWPTTTASHRARRAGCSPSWPPTARCARSRWRAGSTRRFLHPEASCPGGCGPSALLSPFDSLVWERTAHRAAVRLPLPHRDLRAGRAAGPRLLRAPVPPRRPPRRPRRPQGRPPGRPPPGARRLRRTDLGRRQGPRRRWSSAWTEMAEFLGLDRRRSSSDAATSPDVCVELQSASGA